MTWHCKNFQLDLSRPLVMGIVNVTPDSFSDGGLYYKPGEAVARARNCVNEGAAVIDLGGESTRPGCQPLGWQVEWNRLEPVLRILARELPNTPVSIDTYHPETAERALDLGASIINCVYPEPLPQMLSIAVRTGCGLVVPCRSAEDLATIRAQVPEGTAFPTDQIILDPEIGFGTTREEDLALLGSIRHLATLAPVCIGVSRKRLIKKLTGEKTTGKNLGGCLGAAVWCAMCGASVLRVHDVRETRQALDVAGALAAYTGGLA